MADIAAHRIRSHTIPRIRLVRGSHIVVSKLFDHGSAYILQNSDRRVIFAIPYEQDYTLIGTTDVDFAGDISKVAISKEEIDYLCNAANEYFTTSIVPSDVVWSYSGVRSLHDDGQASLRMQPATLCSRSTGAWGSRHFSASLAAKSLPIGT